jgi:hypothetical protein
MTSFGAVTNDSTDEKATSGRGTQKDTVDDVFFGFLRPVRTGRAPVGVTGRAESSAFKDVPSLKPRDPNFNNESRYFFVTNHPT